jgi:transglutaminase-like putative cysteine protease
VSATGSRVSGSWLAFCAFALYGTLRWGTMLGPFEQGRLFASLILAGLAAVILARLPSGARAWAVVPMVIIGIFALLEIAGFPLNGHHVGRLGTELSDGLSSLPGLLVPYTGHDPATAAVLVLGAGLLLLMAALAFGAVRGTPGTAQLALAALPLTGLAVVPSEIFEPGLSYVHGLVTFALVVLLVFSPRLAPGRRASAAALVSVAAVIGVIGAGLIAGGALWVHVPSRHSVTVTSTQSTPLLAEQFNWEQTYGARGWPFTGAVVLEISGARPEHWKAEDLDGFNGRGWTSSEHTDDAAVTGVSAAHRAAYSETLTVHAERIFTSQIIAAGYAQRPDFAGVTPGADPGTWFSGLPVRPGDRYRVRIYAPQPPAAQLAAAGRDYPAALAPFRSLNLPAGVYSGVRALARRLASDSPSPYGDVEAVLDYLQHGYTYTLNPPGGGTYPLVDFLLHTRRGYCQQFAGAMALLLRMDGVPARVAVGFLPGQRQPGTHTYVVADHDAHAWVEVWFPSFGWVTFDPTPGTATAAGTSPVATTPASTPAAKSAASATAGRSTRTAVHAAPSRGRLAGGRSPAAGRRPAGRRGAVATVGLLGLALGLVLAGLLSVILVARAARAFWHVQSTAELTAELERAFVRCEQPLEASITLTDLEQLLSDSPAAAGYVRSLAAARYGPTGVAPTAQDRAALRRWLAQGSGSGGWLRAIRALPPRRGAAGN